ncbi:hypothetical protein [Streptomyces sp. NPDC004008]
MNQTLTDQQLDEIDAVVRNADLIGADIDPATAKTLVAEVRRLRAELATEQAQHAFTLRQRNNRSERLLHLRDLANTGDTAALVVAAKDTLAASVADHTPTEAGEPIHEPSACRWCGIPQREHAQRWAKPVGWHRWEQPTQEQIKARMLARRAAQPVAEDDEGLSGPCDCGEGSVHYTDAECPAAQRAAAPAARSAAV